MKKKWFDRRADDGQHYTITLKTKKGFSPYSWDLKIEYWYEAAKLMDARPVEAAKYGRMTKDEAIAMAKLLNATKESANDSEQFNVG